ncbi:MAG TPA: Ig-like domain-containing protein [Clostridia bacterium]|nr:Ig-like domain-containing protein [Clostridia bacterium]
MPTVVTDHRSQTVFSKAALLIAAFVVLVLNAHPAAAHTPCTLNTASPSVTICTPPDGATVTSPVHIVAGTTSATAVQFVEVWLDGVKKYSLPGHDLDIDLDMSAGTHRLTVQAYNGTYFKKTIYIAVSGSTASCTPGTADPSVRICSPADGAGVASPVNVIAAANSSKTVQFMQVYVDGTKAYQVSGSKLNTNVNMTSGQHRLAVQAYDGTYFKTAEYINVTSGSTSITVTISPESATVAPGGTQQFKATVSGTTNTGVTWYVDGVQGGNGTVGTISSSGLYAAPSVVGSHKIKAVSVADPNKSAQVSVGVSESGCTPGTASPSVTLCSPTDGATVNSPVHVVASTTSSTKVQYLQIYVDGVKVNQVSASSLDTYVTMAAGTRRLTVQAYNGSTLFKKTVYVTVAASTAISVTVSPSTASVAKGGTVQFAASVQNASNTSVTWVVDGITGGDNTVGTVSGGGLYTAPNIDGMHTVTAISDADNSKSDSSTVTVGSPTTSAFSGMFTYKYGNTRQGANKSETILTPSNVNSSLFGKKWTYTVDGYVYAQPLYVPNVTINGTTRNVLYVATEHNSVYAFDANGSTTAPLWKKSFLGTGVTTIPQSDVGSTIYPEIGITGTPVIDPNSKTLYVVAATKESGTYVQRLHALDITNGAEKFGGPKKITATVKGTGDGTDGSGNVSFQAKIELQRPALTLSNGVVYIAWASHGDNGPYHGWVIGYDADTLAQLAVHNNSPNGRRGGIWMSGGGLPVDANGNLYYMSGNGTFTASSGGKEYGDSFVKLGPTGQVLDYFTPFDQSNMNSHDIDLGVGAPTLLPGNRLVGADKKGSVYLVDTGNMGKYQASSNNQIAQYLDKVLVSHCHEQPVYWNGLVYISAETGPVYAFRYSNGQLSSSATKSSITFDFPGTNPVISSNGTANGILWAIEKPSSGGAVLRAFNALDITEQLYSSTQAGSRDSMTTAVKFTPPTVANGKVYVPLKGQVAVFGLLK